ncbi:MAG TPA: ATP-dependent DNA helicase RecG [Solirubrobacteraceae bacterium]|nr:ATP-dependent DNA helicase RecG [Solirubrobacteraceae bacterium]
MGTATARAPDRAGARASRRGGELPRAFADGRTLGRAEMIGAPLRWPRPSRLREPLRLAPGKMADGIELLGLATVGDLLEHLPRASRQARTVAELQAGEQATVAVEVRAISARAVRRRGMRPLVQATVFDASASMRATFFNQPWLVERYRPGTRLLLHGGADGKGGFRVSHHAIGSDPGATGAVPHYPASEGVTSTQILTLVQGAREALHEIPDALPAAARCAERLPDRACALAAMHFPRAPEDLEAGRRRLGFEELLLTQLVFLHRRARRRAACDACALTRPPSLSARWMEQLPFAPTGDQRRAIAAIEADLAEPRAMQRLLLGEVGSGKTVVALHAMLRAVEHGHQAALMAPTETLAEQHFQTLTTLIGAEPVAASVLTGSTPPRRRRDTLGKLANGELSLIVGTHALIEPDVEFGALAVAVVDEQHRFGVRQRAALDAKGAAHMLHMTATPIPRTLALARYGDLDVSTLRELPRGRGPVDTRLVDGQKGRAEAYRELREQLQAGRQAYVVCPLIDAVEGEAAAPGTARAAKAELVRLRDGELSGFRLALLHGGMRARDKQRAMAAFAAGEADVLVATTVIEVGIDVPNATVILVENAERFGISQLHQLRGRVGRGSWRSSCFLAGDAAGASAKLRALRSHADGFRLAEIDLALRKEGELVGTRQSGLGQFRFALLPDDTLLLERARARAAAIFAEDASLSAPEHALLARALTDRFGADALEPIPA